MNDNLPEIDFKEKKEKKGGFLGWLGNKLGIGSRGGAMGGAGISPSAMNVGRALGTAKFGASSGGLAGLLAGKLGMIATVAVVAVAGGLYIANNTPAPSTSNSAFNSGKTGKDYVPAILRSQAANQGSSLDMFKDTNRGAGLAMEAGPNAAKKAPEAKSAPADEAAAQDPNQAAPEQMGQDMMGKLQGGSMGSLTSSLGGGSSKFSGMGGFGNKFNQGAVGAKTGLNTGIGTGFGSMPKFDARKNKMLAMKSNARPVFSKAKAGGKGSYDKGSFNQMKGLRNMQKTYTGSNVDSARSTQDKAWEGSTAEGDAGAGGAGLGEGGAGVMTSPSLDSGGGGGGGGGGGTTPDPVVPPASPPADASPWAGIPATVLALITASLILSAIASYLVSIGSTPYTAYLRVIGYILAAAALAMAGYAMYLGLTLITQYGQNAMGGLYIVGGGAAAGAAILAFAGSVANNSMQLAFSAMAAVAVLIGGMLGK